MLRAWTWQRQGDFEHALTEDHCRRQQTKKALLAAGIDEKVPRALDSPPGIAPAATRMLTLVQRSLRRDVQPFALHQNSLCRSYLSHDFASVLRILCLLHHHVSLMMAGANGQNAYGTHSSRIA